MKSFTKISKVFLYGILFYFLIMWSYNSVLAQSAFNRNDNYDFRGEHYLVAGGSDVNSFNLFIVEDSSDFRKFNLHIKKSRLHLSGVWLAWQYRVDMNNDGTWEQGWTTSNEITVSYTYSNPPNGISANHTVKVEIQYQENPCCGTVNRTKYIPVTIFSTPRVYVDSDNNSFIQLRDEDPTAKIPVLMVEGFDPLNDKFPEIYYNLTWQLVNNDLYPNGYEVFMLNFHNGGRDLRLNAEVLIKAIEKVHEVCPNYKIALAGLSMGGPIGRYTLAKKEDEGGTHNVGLFLSYDSPQLYAHVSPDLQDWIKLQNPNEGAIGELQANLQSVAAKQMLRYNTYDPSRIFHDEFYNELNALNSDGYPHKSYNVAVSNGKFDATYGWELQGMHLMTLKINDQLIKDVPAVPLDLGTGSMITDITMKRYGDIFNNPFIHIWYELQIIFNPSYIPTFSSLDLVNPQFNQITGDIISFDRSKFDDYVVQPEALEHHELSQLTRDSIMSWLNKNSNITVNYNLQEGGSVSPDNYQVQILHGIPITVQPKIVNVNGKQITYNFLEWEDGNTNNPRTFYTSHDVSHTATMKGINVSDNPDGYENNGQSKICVTPDNHLHKVYTSDNKVWYEISSDGGSTWSIANNGKPLANGRNAKCPSITNSGYSVLITFQYKQNSSSDGHVRVASFNTEGVRVNYSDIQIIGTFNFENDYSPVVHFFHPERFIIVWKESTALYYSVFSFNYYWRTIISELYSDIISNTNSQSHNPSLAAKDNSPTKVYLAYQQNSYTSSYIRFYSFDVNGNDISLDSTSYANISSGSGYLRNKFPSIAVKDNQPYVVWVGDGEYGGGGRASKTAVVYGKRVVMRKQYSNGNWSSSFYKYGTDVQNPNINNLTGSTSNYAFGWSEVSNSAVKYVKDPYIYQTLSSGLTGNYVQLSNGDNFQEMYINSFNNSSLPYSFDLTTVESTTKSSTISQRFGREGILSYGRTEYYFAVADILNGEDVIEFVDLEDSPVLTINELNDALYTKAFSVTEGAPVYFSVMYGIADTTGTADLSEEEYVNYTVELIDESTGEVIGEYDNVTYDAENTSGRKLVAYEINTEGMGSREVRLRLAVNTNTDAVYTLGELVNDDQIITKQGTKTISYAGSLEVKEYALSQNYPNPFNPTTNIMYQLPKEGRVTIKLYDILGREIQTLVDEHKSQGRYEFTFDGSKLSSGVYIYRITSGEFTASKKFILMK